MYINELKINIHILGEYFYKKLYKYVRIYWLYLLKIITKILLLKYWVLPKISYATNESSYNKKYILNVKIYYLFLFLQIF